ncbi:hypothetical protein FCM35_KLT05552 [Carex littledalei]|uniref:Uncharacterized protein n=1 Tax=Carex littledalei TaxID=544730 RepID=A0A833V9V9_9POAL|nr:hypothetical protein FCM35_KLT05552 [Carex littledalei]
MGRIVALGSPRVLSKGIALLLCVVLLVFLHTEESEGKNKFVTKVSLEGDCSSMEENGSSMESTQINPLSSKRRVPKGPDPIHNRRSGNGQKPPGKP